MYQDSMKTHLDLNLHEWLTLPFIQAIYQCSIAKDNL